MSDTSVNGGVRSLLRLEGLAVAGAGLVFYGKLGFGWGVFGIFLMAPDLSMAGYLAGPRAGAAAYNFAHSYVGPILCGVFGGLFGGSAYTSAALIWATHIGLDRALGYGLKYAQGFGLTHLGAIGRAKTRG